MKIILVEDRIDFRELLKSENSLEPLEGALIESVLKIQDVRKCLYGKFISYAPVANTFINYMNPFKKINFNPRTSYRPRARNRL